MKNYVSRFIPNVPDRTATVRELFSCDIACALTDTQRSSFDVLKESVIKAPVLGLFQPGPPVISSIDAIQISVEAVALHIEYLWAYPSHSLRIPS